MGNFGSPVFRVLILLNLLRQNGVSHKYPDDRMEVNMEKQEALNRINNLTSGNDFAQNLLKIIRYADTLNLHLLSLSYPNEVEAHLIYTAGISLKQFRDENKLNEFTKENIIFQEIARLDAVKKILQLQNGGYFAQNLFKTLKTANSTDLIALSMGFKNEVNAYLLYSEGMTFKEFTTDEEDESYDEDDGEPGMKRSEFDRLESKANREYWEKRTGGY